MMISERRIAITNPMSNVKELYFDWLCSFVYDNRYYNDLSYRRLLEYLHLRVFYDINPRDANRAEDGIALRYRFAREKGISEPVIASELDISSCSILEMMIALCIRIEDNMMDDPTVGNRTGQWFWEMISSLGLNGMTDRNFDINYTNRVLSDFLERRYEPNGRGGLFTIQNPKQDQRMVEIWYQMQAYLIEVLFP